MKRILSTILLCVTVLCAYSQEDITLFFLNDGTFKGFYDEEIDSITYSHLDLDSIWHTDAVVQEVWLADSVVRIPVEKIDSICHRVPDPVYRPGVVKIDERYLPYITSVEGLTITFSSGLPENLWPEEGSVLLYEGSNEIFPNGFAGTVTKLVDGVAVCDSAAVDDVYERLYFFGSYVLAEDGEGTGAYSAKKIRSRHADDKEDDWGIFEVDPTNIPFDKIKIAEKIDISRANMFAAISGTITPTVTVEAAYVFNVYEPLIFFKATHRFEYDALLQVGFNKDFTPKHHKDIGKPFRMHKLDENRDEKGFHLYFINESVPIPQCPVLTAGFKMGLFIDPKIEAEVVLGLHIQASEDKTHIYRLNKNNIGQLGEWWKGNGPEPETSSCEVELDGSLTGSVWAGLMAAINVGVGTDKCGMKEELSARIGPYIEGKLNLDILDLNKDMSWYSGLKDSKIKRGIKSAFNLDFTAKMPKVFSYKWTQLELSPPKLLFEQDCYLLPAFEAPTYSVQGNSLKCYTSVTRSTVPNHIGLRVKDESGKEVTKWQNFTFDFADEDNPYVISETFDNLDFVNHRYTIIPVTRIWELPALEIPEPSQTCVTCPDSRHPHLIDLGLPSGTKWLCQNVYADDPKDAGGYYQWGKPFMVHAYTDITYRAPNFTMSNYQGSEYDAATANLGQEYCTPTMSQFLELHDNCRIDYKYSPWGNKVLGAFFKGKNGNNLYLPFSGFKSGVKVNNSSEGWFLSSDAMDNNNQQRKAVVIKNNDVIWHSTDALAYGHSVRPVSTGSDGLVIEPQQLDYEVIVGQKVGQSVTVSNNGSASVNITVAQAIAPFQVDDACLGTFTVKPKERLSVLVYFSPSEKNEYTSVLTLSYETGNACVVSKVPLKGKGVDPVAGNSILVMQEAINFGEVEVGGSERRYLTIVNNGSEQEIVNLEVGDPYKLSAFIGENGQGRWYSSHDFSIAPNDQRMIVVHFNPTAANSYNSEIKVTSKGVPGGKMIVPVYGKGIVVQEDPSFHLSTNSIDVYVNDFEGVEIYNGSGEYDIINNYPDIVESDINVPHVAHMPQKREPGGGRPNTNKHDLWNITGKKVGKAVLKVKDKQTSEELTLNVEVKRAPSLLLSAKTVEVPMGEYNSSIEIQSGSGWYNITSENPEIATAEKYYKSVSWVDENGVAHGSTFIEIQGLKVGSTKVNVKDMSSLEEVTLFVIVTNSSYISAEAVDLDLPSGTKWASFNLGATKPEEYGDYYAWGEITPKENYSWSTYKWCNGTQHSMNKYCYDSNYGKIDNKTVLELTDDAAYISLGSGWRLPTREQQDELRENCDWEWTIYNGVVGMKVKSRKNEAFIFLPAAGYRSGSSTSYAAEYGYYQSASLDLKNSDDSYYFYFNSGGHYWQDFSTTVGRDVGFSVRPVMSPNGKPENDVGGSPGNGDGSSGGFDPTHDEYDDF